MRNKMSKVLLTTGALLLVSAMAAWACTNLATLNLDKSAGAAGTSVDITGSSFATESARYAEVSAVEIRWNGVDGAVLATARPDSAGNIATTVRVPSDAAPGYHVLVATQSTTDKEGNVSPAYGTPARAAFSVAGEVPQVTAAPAGPSSVVASSSTSGSLVALTALLAVAGLGLFGAGVGMFVREVRPREVPVPAANKDE